MARTSIPLASSLLLLLVPALALGEMASDGVATVAADRGLLNSGTEPSPAVVPLTPEELPAAHVPRAAADRLVLGSLRLRLGGVVFAYWGYDLASADPSAPSPNGANRFDITRAYIDVEPWITETISLRITPDITRVSDASGSLDGSLALRLKYAYARFDEVLPGVSLRAGLQPTAFISFVNSVWRYRVLGPEAIDLFTRMPSADLGVGALGSHWGGVLETQLLLSNGEGSSKPETSDREGAKYKDLGARITLAPFASSESGLLEKLRLTAYGQTGVKRRVDGQDQRRSRLMGLLTWESRFGSLGVGAGPTWDGALTDDADEVVTQRGLLFTSFGFLELPLDLRLIGRFDRFDPDVGASGREENDGPGVRTRLIAGLAYRFNQQLQLIADFQRFGYEIPASAANAPGETLFLHLEAKY